MAGREQVCTSWVPPVEGGICQLSRHTCTAACTASPAPNSCDSKRAHSGTRGQTHTYSQVPPALGLPQDPHPNLLWLLGAQTPESLMLALSHYHSGSTQPTALSGWVNTSGKSGTEEGAPPGLTQSWGAVSSEGPIQNQRVHSAPGGRLPGVTKQPRSDPAPSPGPASFGCHKQPRDLPSILTPPQAQGS